MASWFPAFRQLVRRPAFTVSVVLLLALGIGANTTLFTLVSTIFLKPLPYPNPERLVWIMETNPSKHEAESLIAPARLSDWKRLNHAFSTMAGFYADTETDTSTSVPERLMISAVTPGFFDVYDRQPALGRTFTQQEQVFNGPPAVVLSYRFWSRRFNRSTAALGKTLILNGTGHLVVGVMPPNFADSTADAWLSAPMNPYLAHARDARFLVAVGRLQPGRTVAQGQSDLALVQKQLGREYPLTDAGWSVQVTGLKTEIIGDHGRFLWLTFVAVGLLLALGCANIAGLLLGHVNQRGREFAVRASLGATRWQVASTVWKELAIVAGAGLALGVLASYWGVAGAVNIFAQLPRIADAKLNGESVLFAAAVTCILFVAIGFVPAWQAGRSHLTSILAQGGRTQAGGRHTFQRMLLVAQFALTLVLLSTAGLLLRSYQRLSHVDTGFTADHVLTFHVGAGWSEDRAKIGVMQSAILTAIGDRPDVASVGVTNFLPGEDASLRYQYQVEGLSRSGKREYSAGSRTVSGGYLKAMRISLLAGTNCPDTPLNWDEPARALVNRAFVGSFADGQNVVGRALQIAGTNIHAAFRITGVVSDVREDNFRTPPVPYVYTCAVSGGWPDMTYVVRTRSNASAFASSVQQIVRRIAPTRATFAIETMETHVGAALAQARLTADILVGFAISALLLAAFGLYSLFALLIATRTREIGTRMALGARTSQVIWLVLEGASRILVLGIACGAALGLAAGAAIRSLLFGVSATDPVTFVGVTLLLALVCLAATLVPALRAASINPVEAIHAD